MRKMLFLLILYTVSFESHGLIRCSGVKSTGRFSGFTTRVKKSLYERKPSIIYCEVSMPLRLIKGFMSSFDGGESIKPPAIRDTAGAVRAFRNTLPTALPYIFFRSLFCFWFVTMISPVLVFIMVKLLADHGAHILALASMSFMRFS